MLLSALWTLVALSCVWESTIIAAQSTLYQFTMTVTSPAPVPGQPFTFTWTGGESIEPVYILLNYYAPYPTNQNIIEFSTDILSNAPNNGSWTYNVPLNLDAGRHSFSIGYNPVMLSDTTDIFIIDPSETSAITSTGQATTNTAYQTFNGCGLVPFPDYTYTGYQPPCTTTISGQVETIYPIVPATDSSSFFGIIPTRTLVSFPPLSSSPLVSLTSRSPTINPAFATGIYAQALQCSIDVVPSTTKITSSRATTILSIVACAPSSMNSDNSGMCHSSGYTTFSVSGTTSVCCPNGWVTTPLFTTELFCFTSVTQGSGVVEKKKRQVSTETLGVNPASGSTLVAISGLVFTSAGIVTVDTAVTTGAATVSSGTRRSLFTSTGTGSVATATTTKSGAGRVDLAFWGTGGFGTLFGISIYLWFTI